MKLLNPLLLILTVLATLKLPSYHLDNEIFYLNALGLGYLAFFIFAVSKNTLFDLTATAFLLLFGLVFDALFSNYHFYYYGLVDYPNFTNPPAWAAVVWLIAPLQLYRIKFKYNFLIAAVAHTLFILQAQQMDLMFVQRPYKINVIFILVIWLMVYRVFFRVLDILQSLKVFRKN